MLNARLGLLTDYPFQRLNSLLAGLEPKRDPLSLHLGEPQHPVPPLALQALMRSPAGWGKYPPIAGSPPWKKAVSNWLHRRFALPAGMVPEAAILPVSGSREALYMLGQAVIPETGHPIAVMPNPFYQVYHASALMSGAEVRLLNATEETGFLPNPEALDTETLDRTAIVTICSPANPQGATVSLESWQKWIALARKHDFILVADECYSEIYADSPPVGVLEACREMGGSLKNIAVFNSLSKRSCVPGMRCGFVSGDPGLMEHFQRLRSYASAGMPLPVQEAAMALWEDEDHVLLNRSLYREKIDAAEQIFAHRLPFLRPEGGFFLWLDVGKAGLDGEIATKRLWTEGGVRVLPGRYLAQPDETGSSIADSFIRIALVHEQKVTTEALRRIVSVLEH